MRVFRLLISACTLTLLFGPVLVRADSCATTTVNNIMGTTCTIGDKTFNFATSGGFSGGGLTANQVEFTPDTSNPLSPGFSLSLASGGALVANASGLVATEIDGTLNYTVSVTNGSATLIGETLTLNNPSVTISGHTGDNAISDATNFLGSLSGAAVETFIQCMVPAGPTGCSSSSSATQLTTGGTFAPVNSASGQAGFELFAQNGQTSSSVSASLTSVDYNFTEIPSSAPEPSSLLLLGSGLAGSVAIRRRLRLRK